MFGLEQIKTMNESPSEYAKEGMSDGQRRRNDDKGKAFWSESAANADDGHYAPINPIPGSEWGTVEEQIKSPVGSFKRGGPMVEARVQGVLNATQEERNMLNESAIISASPYNDEVLQDAMRGIYHDFDVIAGEVVQVPSKDKIMAAMNRPDTFKVVTQPAEGITVNDGTVYPGPDSLLRSKASPLPPIYFDAVQLLKALAKTADQAIAISHQLETAIRAVQHATNESEVRSSMAELNRVVACIMHRNPVLDLNLLIGLLETEAEKLSPAIPPQGNPYRPRHGLDHAMHPIKRIIGKMRLTMAKWALETDG